VAVKQPLGPPSLAEIRAAAARLTDSVVRTPLLRLPLPEREAGGGEGLEIYLKLENLQPIGSFKLRGAGNAMALAAEQRPELLARGVYTASAGNMAQGVAWNARRLGVPCRVIVPEHAPETKVEAIRRLGGTVVPVPFDDWWRVLVEHRRAGEDGFFLHPVSDPAVIAGNATVGLEIAEQLPGLDAVLVPYGCEVATAAPLAAAWAAGEPTTVEYTASFVDGIGSKSVLAEMWPLARRLLAGSRVVSLDAVADAVRLLAERCRVIAEGAGAASVAAALAPPREGGPPPLRGKIVCVVSGGNLDAARLVEILTGSGVGNP